ncbi:MAG: hypothetical protein ACYCS7_15000 [Acidimicrobiales bacterium]
MARKCIFCDGPANSKEDIWPCWMTARFIAPGTMEQELAPDLRMTSRRVDRPKLVVRRVYKKCNNGWMSQLQGRGKPIIERLWDQQEVTLDLHDCKSLALWATMTAMVLQTFDEPGRWLFDEYDRTLMWHEQRIPRFTGIWIANCVGHPEAYSAARSMAGTAQQTGRPARASAVTMAFANLGIQILKVAPAGNADRIDQLTVGQGWGDWENIALQVWPLTGFPVDWPPPRGIRCEEELEIFAGRFRSQPDAGPL